MGDIFLLVCCITQVVKPIFDEIHIDQSMTKKEGLRFIDS